jgi:UDP-N-acetylglucosamine acyltransferase
VSAAPTSEPKALAPPQVHPAAYVDPAAQLSAGVMVEPGAIVGPDVRVGEGTRIGSYARVTGWTRLGAHCQVHHCAVVGGPPQDLKYTGAESYVEVGDHTVLREFSTVHLAAEAGNTTRVGSHCLIMAYAHVAHDCQVGNRVILANGVQMAGFVTVEDWAIIGGLSVIHQFSRVGCHSMIGGASRVPQDVAPYIKLAGNPPRLAGLNAIGLERRGFSAETVAALEEAYKLLFRRKLPLVDAVARIRAELPSLPEVEHLARFAETSVRGLTR